MGSLDCLLVEGKGEGSLRGLGTGVGALGLGVGGGSLRVWLELEDELDNWTAFLQISKCLWPSMGH